MQVIKNQDFSFIDVESVRVDFYYLIKKHNKIGTISRDQYSSGCFVALCFSGKQFTNGDRFGFKSPILKTLIYDLINNEFEVYAFHTMAEWAEKLAELLK